MATDSRSSSSGITRDLQWALGVAVAVVLVLALGALVFLAGVTSGGVPTLWLGGLLVAAVGSIAGAMAFKLSRGVATPIVDLARAARATASGDLSQPAIEHGADEFRDIALAVNRLGSELRSERHHRRNLEKLAEAGRLAAGIANEIGNPLTAISSSLEILRARDGSATERRILFDRIEHELSRAGRIANGLIDLAKPRTIVPLRVDVNEAARSAMRLITEQGLLRHQRGMLLLDPSDPVIRGNRHDLEQLFVNLLLNAVDATPTDGKIVIATNRMARAKIEEGVVRRSSDPPLTIRPRREAPRLKEWLHRVRPPAEIVSVVVADSGRGVPREDWDRVFEPFFTTKPPGEGAGLGLAVVSNIVESLHGTVWLDKAREGGAAIHMFFPVAVGGVEEGAERRQPAASAKA
ncbi:MAG: HAMP domain-containing sensor histidine kinase [Gemmatimonadaceae bacterium]